MQLFETELFGTIPPPSTPECCAEHGAGLFTLIVVAKDIERTQHCQELVHLISRKFPCKIIFISLDSVAKETVVQQRLVTTASSGAGEIRCDVVAIKASIDQVCRIPFLVLPEIVADLPAFLLVGHDPLEIQSIFGNLEPHVERIIFDTSKLRDIGAFAHRILSLPNRKKYIDLNWARTKPWRETIARVFNSRERLSHLSYCDRLDVRYSRRSGDLSTRCSDTQAVYLQAWIASCLFWQVEQVQEFPDHMSITYTLGQHKLLVDISATDSNFLEEGSIASMELHGAHDVHYLLSYERDDRHIAVHASSQDRCEMPYTVFVGSFYRGRALPVEIFQQALSSHYPLVLSALDQPTWHKERELPPVS